jgi:hypothetical protein
MRYLATLAASRRSSRRFGIFVPCQYRDGFSTQYAIQSSLIFEPTLPRFGAMSRSR